MDYFTGNKAILKISQQYLQELQKLPLKLGTRGSMLALWQANHIKNILELNGIKVEICIIKTKGDKILDTPLAKIGGKGLFTKELESSLLNGDIDLAVHSLKDVPINIEPRLCLAAITKREDSRDCFISKLYPSLQDLPKGARVGTTSLRRSMQLMASRPDIDTQSLRGNVQTRMQRLENGNFDAIVLAVAGLKRLGIYADSTDINTRNELYIKPFNTEEMIPAMGQGALGLECRDVKYSASLRDNAIYQALLSLHDEKNAICCLAERAFIKLLGGGCQSPIGIHAKFIDSNMMQIECIAGNLSATRILRNKKICNKDNVCYALQNMVNELKNEGIESILEEVSKHN
ncbi:hydroxymethylbilane synthase [Helicobacter muridarum]|uniref:Porphobilinogen deaminase n=1 Tax=Helicobacter muridarum TaxID=216 RepID=A0A377PRN1_9HELI|nr:hydroxymethylbilane synthase [Helicobacter muridarum]TLE01360.1 hydroxymethylbilane synthase [Helicobacter muridarum]STQ85285.1 porphobilinogen deaminase [Helicobacter muridarum]